VEPLLKRGILACVLHYLLGYDTAKKGAKGRNARFGIRGCVFHYLIFYLIKIHALRCLSFFIDSLDSLEH